MSLLSQAYLKILVSEDESRYSNIQNRCNEDKFVIGTKLDQKVYKSTSLFQVQLQQDIQRVFKVLILFILNLIVYIILNL